MHYRKIPILLSVVCFTGITISSLSFMQESAIAFVFASWIKPFCTIGFVSGLSIYYFSLIGRKQLFAFFTTVLFSSFFFVTGFFINSFAFKNSLDLFQGIHSYILAPSLIATILMLLIAMTKRITFSPFNSFHETVSAALMPLYAIILVSLFSSFLYDGTAKIQWLSKDYLVKPALYKEIKLEETKNIDNIIYSGPLEIEYSMDFIRLYEQVNNGKALSSEQSSDPVITDFAVFSDYYAFVKDEGNISVLLVYAKDGSFIKRIDNVSRIYHSDNALAAVAPVKKHVRMYDSSFNESFRITFPPALSVEKIVFSNELFALLYSKKETGFEPRSTFSTLYRLDTGSRVGRIASADIAPRLKTTGFVTVDNTDEGLYITVLDRNSNKKSYLFKSVKFSNALIRQCGADRFFVKAQVVKDDEITKEYLLVYNLHRYRRLHESFKSGKNIKHGMGNIIAVIGRFLLSDKNILLDGSLKKIFELKPPHEIPYRIFLASGKTASFKAEGSISKIDFSPFLAGYDKTVQAKILLADMKGTLIIKKVIEFSGYFLAITNNRIFVYDRNLQLLKKIDIQENGYINKVKIINTSVLLTFNTEESIYIYSIDSDFNTMLATSINTKQGKIWDISEKLIVYGQEFSSSLGIKRYDDSAIVIAKGLDSDLLYQRVLMSPLYAPPSIEKIRLFLPLRHMTEIVELKSGKRTVVDGNILHVGSIPYGVTNSGHIVKLTTLNPFPYTFDPDKIGTSVFAKKDWIDLHGYFFNPVTNGAYEVIRSGLTTLGENAACSITGPFHKKIIHCLDLDTMGISSTFSVKGDFDIVYSDPDIIFLKDNHSLAAVKIGSNE